jgi:signal transduction histidine kinase
MNGRAATRWLTGPIFGLGGVGLGDIVLAVGLSIFGVVLTSGLLNTGHPHGGVAASIAVLLMTVPVLYARRWPVVAAATLAAGAALNWGLIGHLVRCGAALPAVFFVAFAIGSHCARREVALGMTLLAVSVFCQVCSDPNLPGPEGILLFFPLSVAFMVAGRLLRSRNLAVTGLRARTLELRAQREQNARLAVEADRALIAGGLDDFLHERVDQIAAVAAAGQAALGTQPEQALEAFVAIQTTGRETLTHMREVVGSLRAEAPTEPQPVLAQLGRLLEQATRADARLEVTGDPRLLPPGVELSGYRIVEHLLLALESDAAARVDVVVGFGPGTLQLTVAGPSARGVDARPALAAASERAALLGGTLRTETRGGRRETVVLLPLAA